MTDILSPKEVPNADRVRLLTPTQVAELLQVSTRTLEGWRRKKQGPRPIKLHGVIRYFLDDVEAYLDAMTLRREQES